MGFYKRIGIGKSREILKAPKYVFAPEYTLKASDTDHDELPDGWMWFEDDDAADTFYEVEKSVKTWTEDRVRKLKRMKSEELVSMLNSVTMADVVGDTIDSKLQKKKRNK